MRIHYISDIHLEFMKPNHYENFRNRWRPDPNQADVLVLAGDIGNPRQPFYREFLQHCSQSCKKVFLIAGNHEFYGSTINETISLIDSIVAEFPNISFLHNRSEDYEGIRWVGTTLWSTLVNPLFTINDTEQILDMTIARYKELHQESVKFLEQSLAEAKANNMKCVVITHHIPLYELIHAKYREPQMESYNQWFASRLNTLVETYASCVKGWVYGHTHTGSVTLQSGITFYCNPVGYPGERPMLAYGAEFKV
jgi:predicted phosphohydrolase